MSAIPLSCCGHDLGCHDANGECRYPSCGCVSQLVDDYGLWVVDGRVVLAAAQATTIRERYRLERGLPL